MDLEARSLGDLQQLRRDVCGGAPRGLSRRALIGALRECMTGKPIRVVPCAAPRIRPSEYSTILGLLQNLDWEPFRNKSERGNSKRALRDAAKGSVNFVMGVTKGAAGSSGFETTVPTASGGRQGLNLDIVKGQGLAQKDTLLALWRALKSLVARVDPSYNFTSVQVNRNFAGKVHRDRSDRTYQYALSLGDFSGGELVVSTDDASVYVKHDTRGRLTHCDGRHPHWVTAHKGGSRYSVIMYNVRQRARPRESNLDLRRSTCKRAIHWDARSHPRTLGHDLPAHSHRGGN